MSKPNFAKGREELPGAKVAPEESPAKKFGKKTKMISTISMFKYTPDQKAVSKSLFGHEDGPAGAREKE